jgi:heme/copper-type cytochrome/quinol oxidase subunit 1
MTSATGTPATAQRPDADRARLDVVWARRPGIVGRLTTTNPHDIALRLVVGALVCCGLAVLLVVPMRFQLALPGLRLVRPDAYAQLFTTHGTAMLFLFAVPVLQGVALYVVPLLIGGRSVAFPRLAAFGAWAYLFAAVLLFGGLAANLGAGFGWYNLAPLAGGGPSRRLDVWPQAVTLAAGGAFASALNLLVTAATRRAPGMTPRRIPMFVWATITASLFAAITMPLVALAGVLLTIGGAAGLAPAVFAIAQGDGALLYQQVFRFFAHPALALSLLTAAGILSHVIEIFTRRRLVGHSAAVIALGAGAVLALILWVPHILPTRLDGTPARLFSGLRMLALIPLGVILTCWIATVWAGRPRFAAPLIATLAALVLLVPAGVTAAMLASGALGQQLADTTFAVAHFHLLAAAGVLLPVLAALACWYPKWSGRALDERAARTAIWMLCAGAVVTLAPLIRLGLLGMPPRVYTYPAGLGWSGLNALAGTGVLLMGAALALAWVLLARGRKRGRRVGANPWQGGTLEWSTPSPPPPYNFTYLPEVEHRYPLWTSAAPRPGMALATDRRWACVTSLLDARPRCATLVAGDSAWPLVLAALIAATLAVAVPVPVAIPLGAALIALGTLRWRGDHSR